MSALAHRSRMPRGERPEERGRRLATAGVRRVGEDFRLARIAAGLSVRVVAKAAHMSRDRVAAFERGHLDGVAVAEAGALLGLVGLDLRISTGPGPTAHRDEAHAALLERTRALLHTGWRWRVEVPLPNPGDPRAWDAMAAIEQLRIAFEAETGPRDGQELQRRLALKRRDGGVDHVVLVLADTIGNRRFMVAYGEALRSDFPLSHRTLAAALRDGRDPEGSGVMVL